MFHNKYGLGGVLKDGGRHIPSSSETVLRNIEACKSLCTIIRTSFGPNSMNKLIVNHLEKHFVTSDAATMMKELEVQHPAAKLLIMASEMQEQEFGDATSATLVFADELLGQAEALIKEGFHTSDIIKGFEVAMEKCLQLLNESSAWRLTDPHNKAEIEKVVMTPLASKQLSLAAPLARLISDAVSTVMPHSVNQFTTDSIRVAKLTGGALNQSFTVNGMVVTRDVASVIKVKENTKGLVLACGLESAATETKGTVLLHSAAELVDFTRGEEEAMENSIKSIKDSGVDVIIVGGPISDIALHFANKYKMLVLKVQSKFELRRLCQTIGATALVKVCTPMPEEMGVIDYIGVEEIGSKKLTLVKAKDTRVSTIVLRGSTMNVLEETERAIGDAVSCLKSAIKDPYFCYGGGATEINLSLKLQKYGASVSGLDQYGVMKYAEALECIPKCLADNAGYDPIEVVTQLYAAHKAGQTDMGVNVESTGVSKNIVSSEALDHRATKACAIRLATDAALTVLRIDQLIMSRVAGGPKPHTAGPGDED